MIKALAFVKSAAYNGTSLIFLIDLANLETPFQNTVNTQFESELAPNASAASMNAAISAFVKAFATAQWGTEWTVVMGVPVDQVKLIIAVDGQLL